ncbi:competence type IV pilus major pilin ComGC [Alkalibacillus filiformis]|uniref:competence type IV pilus major pilin ComGC n=1 Tax=Alkalibacillus filiformis TaxID=200990 RepID=UPI0027D83F7B|nr:prepilin-type N-terminal cleavage/methylation domain-containing protein [Alkalibacillus filiformis]
MLKRMLKNQKGITLVELLAVIVILGIIALIAVPAIANVIEDSRYDSVKATAINIIEAGELYAVTNEEDSVTLSELEDEGYINISGYDDSSDDISVSIDSSGSTIDGILSDSNVAIQFTDATIQNINDTSASDLRNEDADSPVEYASVQ